MAGSRTPEALSTHAIERIIRAAGRVPVERDTFYNVVPHADRNAGSQEQDPAYM
jgi:2-iminoacetate synthase ThiH